jgi:uncharacterized protein (TIGR02996 family)
MHDAFLRSLLDSPRDDASRLVYADWLEEQDTPTALLQAEYLRLTVQLGTVTKRRPRKGRRKRLQVLAAKLDTDWLAVVSRIPIENCGRGQNTDDYFGRSPVYFRFVCQRNWVDLQVTGEDTVRHCDQCQEHVHYCGTIKEAREHAQQGHCIAVDLGVIRRDNDLEPPRGLADAILGRPAPGWYEAETRRTELDPVSAERERRKQETSRTDEEPAEA